MKDFEELSRTIKLAKIITNGFERVPNVISTKNFEDEKFYCP